MKLYVLYSLFMAMLLACPITQQVIEPSSEPAVISATPASGTVEVSERYISGTVVENVYDCIFDGLCYVVVDTGAGKMDVIYIPGMMRCDNSNAANEGYDLEVGDTVEAFGEISPEGALMLCSRDAYYLRKVIDD